MKKGDKVRCIREHDNSDIPPQLRKIFTIKEVDTARIIFVEIEGVWTKSRFALLKRNKPGERCESY